MRVLHLAFEDHLRPGSGGGSLRNREVNSRLSAMGHTVDVVAANYPGAQSRVEDGVRYRHCGLSRSYAFSLISHQLCLPAVVAAATRRVQPDVIVEEFAPLTSSLGVGYWTRIPTVGVAQGFFAEEKAREYRLPPRLLVGIQQWGTRSHRQLVAVSEEVKRQLVDVSTASTVTVIPNGVDCAAAELARHFSTRQTVNVVVFLGRLEIRQKGLDVLLGAMSRTDRRISLLIAGDGKDKKKIEAAIAEAGLQDRVQLVGAVHGEAKWRLIADAGLLVQPSRYETFGISVLEAMACGTPVVASDLPCLRELLPATAGLLVPADDPVALARGIDGLLAVPEQLRAMQQAGPEIASRYDWDTIARAQLAVYERAAGLG